MRKFILLFTFIVVSVSSFCVTYSSNNSSYKRLGYSTRYGYGFQNTTNTYSSGGPQTNGAPRRVRGYDSNGDPIDDGQGYGDQDSTHFWHWLDNG